MLPGCVANERWLLARIAQVLRRSGGIKALIEYSYGGQVIAVDGFMQYKRDG